MTRLNQTFTTNDTPCPISTLCRSLCDVTDGRRKSKNELVKQAALQAGKLADQKQAAEDHARERKRAAEDAQRDREAEVKAAVQREERDRESIRQAQKIGRAHV